MRISVVTLFVVLAGLCEANVVLPLGDSVTNGQWGGGFTPGSYRSRLELLDPTISFVGPKSDNPGPGQVSPYHAGWSGITSDWIASHTGSWGAWALQATHVLLLIGTNDVNLGRTVNDTLFGIDEAARSVLTVAPNTCLVLGTLGAHKNGTKAVEIAAVNIGIRNIVRSLRLSGYKAELAPTGDAFEPVATNMVDNLHPSAAGYDAMAPIWLAAMATLEGDIDGDGVVSVLDYIDLSDSFDSIPGDANWNPAADLDGDEVISIYDYIVLSDNFDRTKFPEC